jgi:hypothetical protein
MNIKSISLLFALNGASLFSSGQTTDESKKDPTFSLIVGLGSSYVVNTVYQDPVINSTNGYVIIEKADKMRYSGTLGFSYTPYLSRIESVDTEGKPTVKYKPRGITMAIFANPVSLSTISGSTSLDWGAGLGYRFIGVSLLGTVEFFNVKQPKQYFIDQFKDKNLPLVVNNNIQTDISTSDNSIFRNKGIASFGIKLVVPIDVLKNIK